MTDYNLIPFQLIHKDTGEPLTHKEIIEIAKEKGFFENEFKTHQIMLKENGTPVVFGFNPMVSFSLNKEEYQLQWYYGN